MESLLRRGNLHVKAVVGLHRVVFADVLQNLSDLSSSADRNRFKPVELGIVPIHFCQGENLLSVEPHGLLSLLQPKT